MGEKAIIGVLLISYKDGQADKHAIRWVLKSDFAKLADALRQRQELDSQLASIHERVSRARQQGITDAELLRAGIDLSLLRKLPPIPPWPLTGYAIETDGQGRKRLKRTRVHKLNLGTIAAVELRCEQELPR